MVGMFQSCERRSVCKPSIQIASHENTKGEYCRGSSEYRSFSSAISAALCGGLSRRFGSRFDSFDF